MQEALLDLPPTRPVWQVCIKHKKRLVGCVWITFSGIVPATVYPQTMRCDACISEDSGHDTQTLQLFNLRGSPVGVPS